MNFPSKLHSQNLLRGVLLAAAALLILWLSHSRAFERYELQTYDWQFLLRGPRAVSDKIALVDIWDDTLKSIGRWPFDREYHAALIQILGEAGAKAVVFDVEFVEPHHQDPQVVDAARKAGNVYFAFSFSTPRAFSGRYVASSVEAALLPEYAAAAKAKGFVNIQVDLDGKRRRVMPVITYQGTDYYQLAFRAAMDMLDVKETEVEFKPGKYLKLGDKRTAPLDEDGCFLINFAGLWKETFKHYSYVNILASYAQNKAGEKPIYDLKQFKDKVLLVGLTAQATHDTNPNPLEPVYPGVGTYANTLNTILRGDFIRRVGRTANVLILLLMALCTAWVSFYKRPFSSFLYTLATLAAFTGVVINLFIYAGLWVDLFFPVFVCVAVYISGTLLRIMREMRKRELIESELKIASQIQQSFLPASLPEHKGLGFAAFFRPAKAVGGDLYGFVPLPGEKMGVMVGDVSGKGTPAALFMGKTVSEFKFSSRDQLDPAKVLTNLNDSIASNSTGGLFVTLTYAIFDLAQKKMTMANGGHLPVVVARPGGTAELLTAEGGMPIGVMPGVEFLNFECKIKPGECYAFYTDGISEARNRKKDEYDVAALQKALREYQKKPVKEILNRTVEDVLKFIGKAEQHDDMTLIIVQIAGE